MKDTMIVVFRGTPEDLEGVMESIHGDEHPQPSPYFMVDSRRDGDGGWKPITESEFTYFLQEGVTLDIVETIEPTNLEILDNVQRENGW